jgi:uncharacterized membrane protein
MANYDPNQEQQQQPPEQYQPQQQQHQPQEQYQQPQYQQPPQYQQQQQYQQPPQYQQQQYQQPPQYQQQYQQQGPGQTGAYSAEEIEQSKVISALAYLGILFFLPLVVQPVTRYGKFHANQGLLLLLTSIAGGIVIGILSAIFLAISWRLVFISTILNSIFYIGVAALGILGIVNALQGKAKPLPVIGKLTLIK